MGERFGRYRLVGRIGAGGMARVDRAVVDGPEGFSREVVIKRVLPEYAQDRHVLQMLSDEARLCAVLRHPNIVQVLELGRERDELFIAMEYVDGHDLRQVMQNAAVTSTPMPVGVACFIVSEVAAALAFAHTLCGEGGQPLGILHRDVSPSNIMLSRVGAIKLVDFGIARAARHVRRERTATGTLKGKLSYMAPEQIDGAELDARADIFSLGVVLHECLTGRRLFRGRDDQHTMNLVREARVEPPSTQRVGVDPALDRIVVKMLSKDLDNRYQDCAEVVAALRPLVHALGGDPHAVRTFVDGLVIELDPAIDETDPARKVGAEAVGHDGTLRHAPGSWRRGWRLPGLGVALVALLLLGWAAIAKLREAAPARPRETAPAAPPQTAKSDLPAPTLPSPPMQQPSTPTATRARAVEPAPARPPRERKRGHARSAQPDIKNPFGR
jgi:hypothetical protein